MTGHAAGVAQTTQPSPASCFSSLTRSVQPHVRGETYTHSDTHMLCRSKVHVERVWTLWQVSGTIAYHTVQEALEPSLSSLVPFGREASVGLWRQNTWSLRKMAKKHLKLWWQHADEVEYVTWLMLNFEDVMMIFLYWSRWAAKEHLRLLHCVHAVDDSEKTGYFIHSESLTDMGFSLADADLGPNITMISLFVYNWWKITIANEKLNCWTSIY